MSRHQIRALQEAEGVGRGRICEMGVADCPKKEWRVLILDFRAYMHYMHYSIRKAAYNHRYTLWYNKGSKHGRQETVFATVQASVRGERKRVRNELKERGGGRWRSVFS